MKPDNLKQGDRFWMECGASLDENIPAGGTWVTYTESGIWGGAENYIFAKDAIKYVEGDPFNPENLWNIGIFTEEAFGTIKKSKPSAD